MTSIKREDLIPKTEDETMSIKVIADPGQTMIRIDKFLHDKLEGVSRNRIQKAIENNRVLVNEKYAKRSYKIKPNDSIVVFLNRDPEQKYEILAQDIPLDIVYEDDYILVVNKPAGMVVHPGVGNHDGTLVNALMYHLNDIVDLPYNEGNSYERPFLVHRIDKDTSGLLVTVKTEFAMTHLAKQFRDHTAEREYVALVWGDPEPPKHTIDANIGRHPTDRLRMHMFKDGEEGKHAVTHYEVEETFYYVSIIKCRLETGRTHQIRVHMSYSGHPLFNDVKYGGHIIRKGTIFSKYKQFVNNCFQIMPRQALHARTLGFDHPATGERMFFECPMPDDFTNVIEKWRNYSMNRKNP